MPSGKSILFVPLIAALLISCSAGKEDKGEEVASVNGAPIYMQEFMKEVKTISRR